MFRKNATRAIAITMSLAMAAFALPADAEAGHKGKRYYHGHNGHVVYYDRGHRHHRHYHRKRHRGHDAGVAVAAGILGLTVGALIAGSANQHYYAPRRTYHQPRRVYREHRRSASYGYEPFTGPWYRYCAEKYRSFDARSGTFMTYSGVRKLCR